MRFSAEEQGRGYHYIKEIGMKYETVLFDMDGTLLDTLEDLRDGVNVTLGRHGYPEHTLQEIRTYVGSGAGVLIRKALPKGTPEEEFRQILKEYKEWYRINYCTRTRPYPGVRELLSTLRANGVKTAVVSNKPHAVTKKLAEKFFPGLPAFGQTDGAPRKPAPDMVWHALEALGADRGRSVYVGDSEVDVTTARNAKMPVITVDWGFRTVEQLRAAGADTIVSSAEELAALL